VTQTVTIERTLRVLDPDGNVISERTDTQEITAELDADYGEGGYGQGGYGG
jgi:hypothetical protein